MPAFGWESPVILFALVGASRSGKVLLRPDSTHLIATRQNKPEPSTVLIQAKFYAPGKADVHGGVYTFDLAAQEIPGAVAP